jgi:putative FmdB family regulatory protein
MPFYEYVCETCEHEFEAFQKISDEAIRECPECGRTVRKKIFAPVVQFKGAGFYETEYGRAKHNHPEKGSEAKGEAKTESKSESKPDSKPETKSETAKPADTKKKAETPKSEAKTAGKAA